MTQICNRTVMTGQTCSFNHQTLFGRFPIKEWPEGRKSQHNFVPFIYERCESAISERCRFTLKKRKTEAKCRVFKNTWTFTYLFTELESKLAVLILWRKRRTWGVYQRKLGGLCSTIMAQEKKNLKQPECFIGNQNKYINK